MTEQLEREVTHFPPAKRGEILAWACYDVANSAYATVVATAVYNAYFVGTVAGGIAGKPESFGTVLLTIVICVSSLSIVISAPIVGTICDATGSKKKLLFFSTILCIFATAALYFVAPGQYLAGMILMTVANVALFTGEDLIAAFLPELAHKDDMGRISALGWGAGYVGGLFSLGACVAYMHWASQQGLKPVQYIPVTMVLCAIFFAIAVIPTFVWLKERAVIDPLSIQHNYVAVGFARLRQTVKHARHYRDLFNFLVTLFVYSCGTQTIIHLASVYAQKVFQFTAQDSVTLMLVVIITAAVGAGLFGFIQDRAGSVRTLVAALSVWMVAILVAAAGTERWHFWIAANLVGIAMGASGSVGRALVAQFSPPGRSGEFLGLWGMAVKLATCTGAMTFGTVTYITQNNYRLALLSTGLYFVLGIILLFRVDEKRGKLAAVSLEDNTL